MPLRRKSPAADIDEQHVEVGHPKSVVIRLAPDSGGVATSGGQGDPLGSDRGKKSDVEPQQLS